MSTTSLLRFSLSSHSSSLHRRHELPPLYSKRRRSPLLHSSKLRTLTRISSKAVEFTSPSELQLQDHTAQEEASPTVLLDVSGMMCGACVTRVKSIIAADERVESVVVNMLTETAAIKLNRGAGGDFPGVAEELAARVSASGFDARRRASGMGVEAKVRKWRETVEKKEALLVKSRNRVAFAWTLVALCCGSHASHILHSVGIHIGHGSFLDILHNSYVKGGLALGSLLGPGRDLLFDGLRAFRKGSPNMNSLVGFGSIAAFGISAVFAYMSTQGTLYGQSIYFVRTCLCLLDQLILSISWRNYIGTHIFPEVLLNDIAGPDGNSLLLSMKLAVDVLVGAKQGLLIRGGDVLERLAGIDYITLDKTGTLTEGKPAVSAVVSIGHEESEILQIAAAVEKTASHPLAKAIIAKAESLNLHIPSTSGQLAEPGSGTLAEVDGLLVAVGKLSWVHERFQQKTSISDVRRLEQSVAYQSSVDYSSSNHSRTIVYVGREGEGIIGAIAISDNLRRDAESTVTRLQQKGIRTVLLSGDREEAVAAVAKTVGIENEFVNSSLTPQQKSGVISGLQASGHRVAMVGDGINDAPSLALADVGIALQIEGQENAASNAASIILLGNRLSQVVDAIDLSRATMGKVRQNLTWAVAYNVIAIPMAAGVLLPHFDFAMTPSLSGGMMALSSIFVVTNSLLLQFHGIQKKKEKSKPNISSQ
ncbi:copper-transporting ATPase paa2 chloroplastic [Phtheirospermum japonicum]|uniref:Copper-transporting ATPase paa2 chloroplastic n=1 Tax=Phtheirospermum japonicum TaxID=374723 RepID=A0A830CP83_9LAMI|nr:copper-transporting ATPase paa2 chloroplastic [Phtheirospermum japonicum]